jgi:hypothetical protein
MAHEIEIMRRAADIASAGHACAMRACRPGMAEYELEAELSYEFRRRGAAGHAYTPIVAGGANACILHYVENNRLLAGHSLVLIDAGCELDGYASDITRTFPVSGRFSPEQREVYEIVLAAQQAAIDAVRPGASFMDYHQAALRVLSQGLIDLKADRGSVDGAIESEAYKPWYMHRTGHWLGLDVHDVGEYKTGSADNAWVKLLPGMTLTVEPGLYFRPGTNVPPHLHGIGVRIEDDVLVRADGCTVYTSAPQTVAEIEEVMCHAAEHPRAISRRRHRWRWPGWHGTRAGPGRRSLQRPADRQPPARRLGRGPARPGAVAWNPPDPRTPRRLERPPATPIETIHVSQRGGFGRTLIDAADYGIPALGYVMRYRDLAATLDQSLATSRRS